MAVQRQLKAALPVNFADKRREGVDGLSTDGLTTPAEFTDMTALDTYLTAQDATMYSATKLFQMTHNDKVFAARTLAEGTSI